MTKNNREETEMVRVSTSIKKKVAKKIAGTKKAIGVFYDEAAEEKLNSKQTKK